MSQPADGPLGDRTFAAVLFDLDGTLVGSIEAIERSWDTWTRERGIDPAVLDGFHGMPARAAITQLVAPADVESSFRRLEDLEVGDVVGVHALPGAAEALAALGSRRAAIVTSGTRPLYAARVAASGLRAPTVTVTASDITRGKPDPEPYQRAAALLGVDPSDCLVVEDAPSGLVSGRAAGATTLGVLGTATREELADTGAADAVVGGLGEVRFAVTEAGGIRVLWADTAQ